MGASANPDCPTLMYSKRLAAIPSSFPGVIAHATHSLTIPDIHVYFPINETDDTEITLPVVNPDLKSTEPIIFHPPDFHHSFSSPALRAVDQTLSHMNSPDYGIWGYSDLDKLVHAAHMQDIWQSASKAYAKLQVIYSLHIIVAFYTYHANYLFQ